MNEQEKLSQLESQVKAPESEEPNDLPILFPDAKQYTLGDRTYTVLPFKIKQQKHLASLIKLLKAIKDPMDFNWDEVVNVISILLNEPDKDFLESNIDNNILSNLFVFFGKVNMAGVPEQKKKVS